MSVPLRGMFRVKSAAEDDRTPVPLEEVGKVERWLGEQSLVHQIKRDQQPPDTTVAVEEGMDGLELNV